MTSVLSPWRPATLIERSPETARGANLVFAVPAWQGHRAGQHVDVRLTAADGYQAQRSYSIASPPGPGTITLTVERLEDGEVSPYLVDEMGVGDAAEVRGPIGDWFAWWPGGTRPLLLVAGGFGIVPLMSMVRHRAATGSRTPTRLIVSARTPAVLPYRGELDALREHDETLESTVVFTRSPGRNPGVSGRLNRDRLASLVYDAGLEPSIFVCGPTGFVETVAGALVELGHEPAAIRTERFGATGDERGLRAA